MLREPYHSACTVPGQAPHEALYKLFFFLRREAKKGGLKDHSETQKLLQHGEMALYGLVMVMRV